MIDNIKRILPVGILLLLGIITFYTHEIRVSADMGWYMNSALNIFTGKGYTNMDGSMILNRGPAFPLMIAVSYWLFGVSPWSAFWVVRIFCILNPILIYFIGKRFFGKRIGLIAGLLILTSYSINFWSYRHLDAIWPFFVIIASYFTILGFEKKTPQYFLISALCLGTGVLVKEVVLIFLPLPLLHFIGIYEYRKRKLLVWATLNIVIALLVIFPWFYYLWKNGAIDLFMGRAGPFVVKDILDPLKNHFDISQDVSGYSMFGRINNYLKGLWHYYYVGSNSIHANFIFAPVFVLAWVFTIIKAFRGDKYHRSLTIHLFLFLPILYFVGKNNMRLGQGIFLILISYLLLAVLLDQIAKKISIILGSRKKYSTFCFLLITSSFILIQIFATSDNDLGYKKFIKNSVLYNEIIGNNVGKSIVGPFDDKNFNKIIHKIKNIISLDDSIMVDWYYFARATYFKLNGKVKTNMMPILWCTKNGTFFSEKPYKPGEKPLIVHSNNRPLDPQYQLYFLFESKLIEKIKLNDTKYIILTPVLWQLKEYFSNSPNFIEIYTVGSKKNNMYHVYRAIKPEMSKYSNIPIFTKSFEKSISKLNRLDYKKYIFFRDNYIYNIASINPTEFEMIEKNIK